MKEQTNKQKKNIYNDNIREKQEWKGNFLEMLYELDS